MNGSLNGSLLSCIYEVHNLGGYCADYGNSDFLLSFSVVILFCG